MAEAEARPLRLFHALSALLLATFVAFHIVNHLVGLSGQDRHIAMMAVGRRVYRWPPVEALLLAAFAWQVGSGVTLVIRGWRSRRGVIAWAQAGSGLYLALFLLLHVGAVLTARWYGVDSDFRFAAQGLHIGFAWYFIPYYTLAVLAVFTHVGCALYWLAQASGGPPRPWIVLIAAMVGAIAGGAIVASLGGLFFPVTPPIASIPV